MNIYGKIMEIRYNIYIISSYSDSGKLMITSGHTHNVYTYIYTYLINYIYITVYNWKLIGEQ